MCLVVFGVMVSAVPSTAGTASFYNESACLGGDKKMKASTKIIATESGSRTYVNTGSMALVYLQNCAENATRYGNLKLRWTVTAHGWGIDSCGGSVPAGGGCSGGGFSKTMTFEEVGTNVSKLDQYIGGSTFYFDRGTAGDTTKVCSKVDGALGTTWVVTVEGCTAV